MTLLKALEYSTMLPIFFTGRDYASCDQFPPLRKLTTTKYSLCSAVLSTLTNIWPVYRWHAIHMTSLEPQFFSS
jgi:hypothetical protein